MVVKATKYRGVIAVLVLVLLVLVAALLHISTFRHLKLLRQECAWIVARQQYWLTRAALERLRARLSVDPHFRGETWTVSLPEEALGAQGVVKLAVHDHKDALLVDVEASSGDTRVVTRYFVSRADSGIDLLPLE